MKTPHALVTGGAGFIGSHVVDRLLARGFQVTVLDCLVPQVHADGDNDADGWPRYLNPAARRIRGDILDDGVFEASLPGVTHLVHLAASVGVGQSMTQIAHYTRNNVMTCAIMLEVLARGGHSVERIAVASSMSIYGEGQYRDPVSGARVEAPPRSHEQLLARRWEPEIDGRPLEAQPTAEDKPLAPTSIYAINKRDHEEMFLVTGRALGIPTVALRLFNTYGSRQALSNPYTGVAAIFISRLLNDQPPLIFEDGGQRRDFVHVHDVAEAFTTVLESDAAVWGAFNVGSGRSATISDVAHTLARLLGKNIAPDILHRYRIGDIRHCFADARRLEDTFGFHARHDLSTGLEQLIEWVQPLQRPTDRVEQTLAELSRRKLLV